MEVYGDDEKDNLKIVEKGSLAKDLLDNEAEEIRSTDEDQRPLHLILI